MAATKNPLIAGIFASSLTAQLSMLPTGTLSAIIDLMAKDFGINRPKFKDVEKAVKFIMDTDDEDLTDFIKLVERKGIHTFKRGVDSQEVNSAITKIGKSSASKPSKKAAVTSLRDRKLLSRIREDAMTALKEVADKYGLNIDAGNGSFTEVEFGFKVNFKVVGNNETGVSAADEAHWNMLCLRDRRLKEEWLGKSFRSPRGELLTIIGANCRSRRYNISLRREDGARVKCDASYVAAYMR